MSRIEKWSILWRKYCKAQLLQKLEFLWFQGPFFMIWGGLGTNFQVDLDSFGTQTCYLACLVASLWCPGGPWGDWEIGEHKKGHFEVQAWFILIFGAFRNPILRVLWVPWSRKCVFCYACFQAAFSGSFWVWIWMSRIEKLSILSIAKLNFRTSWNSHVSRLHFTDFGWPWDQISCGS